MKTSLCSFCLKSGILCQKCSVRVKSGEISELDLSTARLLLSLEEEHPVLQNVRFHKAVDADGVLALVVGRGDASPLLSQGGKIVKTLGAKTGKIVRVLEDGVDDRKFLEDLFSPLSIMTINTIWLPDGSTETRVILKRRRRWRPTNIEALKKIAQRIRNMIIRVEFSR